MVKPFVPQTQTIKQNVSEVRCKQGASKEVPPEPRDTEWVTYYPPSPPATQGMAVLSEKAVLWIIDVLSVAKERKDLRQVEHDCLDQAEKKGLIRQ